MERIEAIKEPKLVKTTVEVETEDWDLVIEPKVGLFSLNLAELWRYRDLLFLFVKRDISAQYKQTVLGPVWHFIQPALTTVIFLLVFRHFARVPTGGIEPILFYLSGITCWNYFAACFTSTANTFVANAGIFGKVYFPRLVIPLSVIMSNLVRLAIQFGLLLACILFFYVAKGAPAHLGWNSLLLPVIVLIMAGMGLGLGIIVSSLTTKYRDLSVLVGFGVQLLMYATPVAYPLSFLKSRSFAVLVEWNPLSPVVEGFRYALFNTADFQLVPLVYSLVFTILVLGLGVVMFNKVERTFIDTV